ncbi:type IV toxin-antitoxin system AbiEi family antitoxin domain-containing protein [Leucobacter celer]|uniref:type IV toxin-antitoxin system AbiEi family antitoxin domain-containing protein n=1 Tax=Leucobacter celer TaxID=668625 RepID=UPI0006A7749C|nr:type IV toxin-antitoxin system AbiEi family antitoxin domain-containing protein [Leucobacter celer]
MSVVSLLSSEGGVARASALLARGASEYRIAAAIGRGEVTRPRRGWLALPGADPELLYAARHGVVLSCVSQARRLGLWTIAVPQRHVAASSAARAEAPGCVVHWGHPVVPRAPGALEDPIQNVLQYVAGCQPLERALVIWESALNKRMVDLASLSRLPFRGRARHLLEVSRPFSDSGLESLAASRLRWLRVPLLPQAHLFGHRVDLLIGERLVLQIDGADHTGKQRDEDNEFDAFLKLRGYHVIRVGYTQVMFHWHEIQLQVMEAVAQGLHLA